MSGSVINCVAAVPLHCTCGCASRGVIRPVARLGLLVGLAGDVLPLLDALGVLRDLPRLVGDGAARLDLPLLDALDVLSRVLLLLVRGAARLVLPLLIALGVLSRVLLLLVRGALEVLGRQLLQRAIFLRL